MNNFTSPFFKYYGSKWRLAKYYGAPRRDIVVETFAGSACYSIYWKAQKVKLYDLDPIVCDIWRELINCDQQTILNLPDYINDHNELLELPYPWGHFIFRWIKVGPQVDIANGKTSGWYYKLSDKEKNKFGYWSPARKKKVAESKWLIEKWTIDNLSYEQIPIIDAHYHVDPPYQHPPGKHYRFNNAGIDFNHLAEWCKKLPTADVCEMSPAAWLPFRPLRNVVNCRKGNYTEVIWTKNGGDLGI